MAHHLTKETVVCLGALITFKMNGTDMKSVSQSVMSRNKLIHIKVKGKKLE